MIPAIQLPFVAPIVDSGYRPPRDCAGRSHFHINRLALRHYVHETNSRLKTSSPVAMIENVPNDTHGFGSYIIAHMDNARCVASLEYVTCREGVGMESTIITPTIEHVAVPAALHAIYKDVRQLQRWGAAIANYGLHAEYQNTELFDLLARVPQR